ncbi:MAG: DMT family transporter [Burkholderiaceae bacterium]|nr:DMT family transporter [Burkholderiaceae bacterium]
MSGALVSFMAMAIAGRELSSELGTFQILAFRSAIGLVIVLMIASHDRWRGIATQRPGLQVLRNLAHYGGQFGWFYGIALIPLAQVFAIEFTVPIWTLVLATVFLRERLSAARLSSVLLGFAGMLLILRPGVQSLHPAALAVLGGALGYAASYVMTKRLVQTDSPLAILFWMTLIQLPLGILPSLSHWIWPSPSLWPWLVIVGVTALSAHFCLSRALALADAMVIVPLDFLRLPLVAVVGAVFYGEALDAWVLIGALVMLAGNLVNIAAERRRQSPTAHNPDAPRRAD